MSKRRKNEEVALNLFAQTGTVSTQPKEPSKKDKIRNVGVGLRESEWAELERRAEDLGVSRNALVVYLIRQSLTELRDGALVPQFRSVRELDHPK